MFDLDLVRYICRKLCSETDLERQQELAETLRSVIRLNNDEIRVRHWYYARRFPEVISRLEV
jgi:hypothetical protein